MDNDNPKVVLKTAKALLAGGMKSIPAYCIAMYFIYRFGLIEWGRLLPFYLLLHLTGTILSYGSDLFLFSKSRDDIDFIRRWNNSFRSRFVFLILLAALLPVIKMNLTTMLLVGSWLTVNFFSEHFRLLSFANGRKGYAALVTMVCGVLPVLYFELFRPGLTRENFLLAITIPEAICMLLLVAANPLSSFPSLVPGFDFTYLKQSFPGFVAGLVLFLKWNIITLTGFIFLNWAQAAFIHMLTACYILVTSMAGMVLHILSPLSDNSYLDNLKKIQTRMVIAACFIPTLIFLPWMYYYAGWTSDVKTSVNTALIFFSAQLIFFNATLTGALRRNSEPDLPAKTSLGEVILQGILTAVILSAGMGVQAILLMICCVQLLNSVLLHQKLKAIK